MKKSTVTSLIVALVIIFIGCAMMIVSNSKGGFEEAKKMSDEKGFIFNTIPNKIVNISFDSNQKTISGDSTDKFKVSDINSLVVSIGGGEIEINDSEDEFIYVNILGMHESQIYVEDETLFINSQCKPSGSGQVILSIPASTKFDDVSLSIGASSLVSSPLTCKYFGLELGAGEANFSSLTVSEEANIELGAGDLYIESAEFNDLEAEIGLGNFEFTGIISGDLNAECGMGNASFNFKDSAQNHNFDISADMGNITFDGQDYSGLSAHAGQNNNADSMYTVECGMGNIDINFAK